MSRTVEKIHRNFMLESKGLPIGLRFGGKENHLKSMNHMDRSIVAMQLIILRIAASRSAGLLRQNLI